MSFTGSPVRSSNSGSHPGGDAQARVQEHPYKHIGEKRYKCLEPGCGKSYSRAHHLKRHTDSRHAPSQKTSRESGVETRTTHSSDQAPATSPSDPTPKIPRPNSAFFLFRSELIRRLKDHDGQFTQQTISKTTGELWNELPEEQKKVYMDQAQELKVKHLEKYPDYKYTPGKKRTKRTAEEIEATREYMIALPSTSNPPISRASRPLKQESKLGHHFEHVQDPVLDNSVPSPSFGHSTSSWSTMDHWHHYSPAPSAYQNPTF